MRVEPSAPAVAEDRRRLSGPGRWVGAGAVVVLVVLAFAALTLSREPSSAPLDPQNALPGGARAVAAVVAARGVDVDIVRSQGDLAGAGIDAGSTVLVAQPADLSVGTAAAMLDAAQRASDLVVLGADDSLLDVVAPDVVAVRSVQDRASAGCTTDLADPEEELTDVRYVYAASAADLALRCFTGPDGSALVRTAATGRPAVTLVGSQGFLANDTVLDADNAALALRLLGRHPRLVWYVPSADDVGVGDPPARDSVVPAVLGPALLVISGALVGLMLWRGRRLGPLVTEPLPVVVRAAETTESRGRLYRRAKDRGRAVAVLQQATRARLATYLGLPPVTDVTLLAAAAAAAAGRPYGHVLALLSDPSVSDDGELMHRAGELAALERAVRGR